MGWLSVLWWMGGCGSTIEPPPRAPRELASAFEHLSTFRTVYQGVGLGILRVDAAEPAFALDLYDGRQGADGRDDPPEAPCGRLSWNGESLYWSPKQGEPILLPPT